MQLPGLVHWHQPCAHAQRGSTWSRGGKSCVRNGWAQLLCVVQWHAWGMYMADTLANCRSVVQSSPKSSDGAAHCETCTWSRGAGQEEGLRHWGASWPGAATVSSAGAGRAHADGQRAAPGAGAAEREGLSDVAPCSSDSSNGHQPMHRVGPCSSRAGWGTRDVCTHLAMEQAPGAGAAERVGPSEVDADWPGAAEAGAPLPAGPLLVGPLAAGVPAEAPRMSKGEDSAAFVLTGPTTAAAATVRDCC